MSVSVSIVTHQSARHVEACLDAVRAQGPCVREILLADSGSRDDTLARVRAGFPEVRVHVLGRNAGFAAAHNHNFKRSRGSFWFVLNPDVVLRPGCIESLLACLRRDAGLAGAAAAR